LFTSRSTPPTRRGARNLRGVTDVAGQRQRVAARRADLFGELLKLGFAPRHQRQPRAFACETPRQERADAARGARYERPDLPVRLQLAHAVGPVRRAGATRAGLDTKNVTR
jgi:hypothetical protein